MRLFKIPAFTKWATKEHIKDSALRKAITEIENGLVDAELGGMLYKKRIAVNGRGKRSGSRTLIAYRATEKAFFLYGYMKNQKENITETELIALKKLAKELLDSTPKEIAQLLGEKKIDEVLKP